MLTLTLNKGAVICTFATQSVRTTHVRRKQMWISLSYIDPSNRNKKHRLWNKAPYVCLWLLVSFLYSYLLTDYITWGWISAFFLTSCKAQHEQELPHEQTEKCHIVIVSSLVSLWQGWEAIQGSKYLAQTIFSTVEADQRPQAALEEILSVHSGFWLGRSVFSSCNMQFRQ